MPASIGVNLRVTGHCRQGGRKYMEDFFSVAYQQTQDEKDLEYAFFGIFDGHGGMEAATFAKEHLMESIVRQKNFWSDKDDDVLKAIKDGYINTHYAMWREQEKWPKTASGLPSTAGTTASVAFIRRGKIYIGHVGDSGIILGFQEPGNPIWQARPLTEDHKPENQSEMSRIEQSGGKVVTKSGVPRVVWNRPRIGHKGPVRRSTPIDEIPFLAVARSLGDLWSYNSALDEFVVSPDPDTICIPINADTFRCLIFGTDGLWNMISPASAVSIVQVAEQHNERTVLAAADSQDARGNKVWINPSKCLVERALERWSNTRMRADNTSVITLMLDPPGPPRAEVIKNQRLMENRRQFEQQQQEAVTNIPEAPEMPAIPEYPKNGLEILTLYEDPPIATYPENIPPEINQNLKETTSPPSETPEKPPEPSEIPQKPEKITERRLTEENLNKIHRQILNDINSAQINQTNQNIQIYYEENAPVCDPHNQISTTDSTSNKTQNNKSEEQELNQDTCVKLDPKTIEAKPELNETIQINEVSSSSPDKPSNSNEVDEVCSRCTRSQDSQIPQIQESPQKTRKSLRMKAQSSTNTSSANVAKVPARRKTRSSLLKNPPVNLRKPFGGGSKREHSDPEMKPPEPPQKLRRSQSLGPRDFTLRSREKTERSLRERTGSSLTSLSGKSGSVQGRSSLVTLAAGSANTYRKISNNGKHFTPVKQAIQTRNRVKRLNK